MLIYNACEMGNNDMVEHTYDTLETVVLTAQGLLSAVGSSSAIHTNNRQTLSPRILTNDKTYRTAMGVQVRLQYL
jgi:hypothetical protein